MGLTVSAVEFKDGENWSLVSESSSSMQEFLVAFEDFSAIGVCLDPDLRHGGLDWRESVELLYSICGKKPVLKADEVRQLMQRILTQNQFANSFSRHELSVGKFLHVCSRNELGIVFV